jgi:murein peptide amidase A
MLAWAGYSDAGALAPNKVWCTALVKNVPGLALEKCLAAALQPGGGQSVQGRTLWLRDVAPRSGTTRLKVLVLGAMHGDEATSSTVVFDWIARAERANDAHIYWRMLPTVNPDGLLRHPATRVNARGVDLNRNFPTKNWIKLSRRYWVTRTRGDPRRFPGPVPLSEPETRWVEDQIASFKPDLIVSIHAPYGVLDFDGPPPPPSRLGGLYLDPVGIYPGSLGNYGGVEKGVPVVTVELKNARRAPAAGEMKLMWNDLAKWIDNQQLRLASAGSKGNT